jgi:hypothetical protein
VRYIVGVRMRRQKEVNTSVLGSRARWFKSVPERINAKDPSPLKVKEVWVKERRYIVCLNEEERRKDAHDREAIVAHLKEQLRSGDKSLVGNKGYRRYLKVEGSGHFVIDEKQVKAEERYDGIWVLRTNTVYTTETVAQVYKALWTIEDIFRTTKSILETESHPARISFVVDLTRHVSGVKTFGSMSCPKALARINRAEDAAIRLSKSTLVSVNEFASNLPIQAPEKQTNKGEKLSFCTMCMRAIGPRAVAKTILTPDANNCPKASLTSALKW